MRFATLLTMAAGMALAQQDFSLSYREEGSRASDSLLKRQAFTGCKHAKKPSDPCYF